MLKRRQVLAGGVAGIAAANLPARRASAQARLWRIARQVPHPKTDRLDPGVFSFGPGVSQCIPF